MRRHTLLFTLLLISIIALACDETGVLLPLPTAALVTQNGERPDGAELVHASNSPASAQNPAFSPDGTRLLFTRFDNGYNDGPASLFLLDLRHTSVITRLTPVEDQDNVNLPGAAWNAVNDRIILASDRAEADDLWRVAPDGSDFSRVTTHSGPPWYIEPSWSPDGQWIVFEADDDVPDDQQQGSIWKVRADGSALTELTDGPGGGTDDRQPNWSPAGDRILFQRHTPGSDDWDIYTVAPDGSGLQQVTTAPSSDTDASWSPDGGWIVYSSDYGGLSVPNIFVIAAKGGAPIRVTHDDTHADTAPSWSPGGEWIVFESHLGHDEDAPASLWCIAAPSLVYLPAISKNSAPRLASPRQPLAHTSELTASVCLPLVLSGFPFSLDQVNDFLYQLQNLDLTAVGDSAYDLVVMDYSSDGSAAGEFTAAQIKALKHSAGGEKIVLAYMSIGEAEDYRFYWQAGWEPGNPAWLDEENPNWGGNYKVRYWDPDWQTIIFDYTDRLLDAGFDGAYLDIIDAYEYYADQRPTAAQEMADFVAAIRAHARARDPDFLIFPQNSPELARLVPGYLDSVDGIGQEDIHYGYDGDDVMTPPAVTAELEGDLDLFTSAGKLVLTVDYATTPAHVDDAYAKSQARGYVPFVTVRDLDQLTVNPGHEPD